MNKEKLEHLIATMRQLANDVSDYRKEANWHYEWMDTNHCTVGMLAKRLLEDEYFTLKDVEDAKAEQYKKETGHRINWSTWSDKAAVVCPQTLLPMSKIVELLFDYGLTQEDFINLEFGSREAKEYYQSLPYEQKDDVILNEDNGFSYPLDAAHHLRAVACELERRHAGLLRVTAPPVEHAIVRSPVVQKTQHPVTVGVGHAT